MFQCFLSLLISFSYNYFTIIDADCTEYAFSFDQQENKRIFSAGKPIVVLNLIADGHYTHFNLAIHAIK